MNLDTVPAISVIVFFNEFHQPNLDIQYDSVSNWWLKESFPLCQSFISRVSLKMNGAAVLLSMCGICGSFSIQDRFWGISNSIGVLEASPLGFVPTVLTFVLPSLKFLSHYQIWQLDTGPLWLFVLPNIPILFSLIRIPGCINQMAFSTVHLLLSSSATPSKSAGKRCKNEQNVKMSKNNIYWPYHQV